MRGAATSGGGRRGNRAASVQQEAAVKVFSVFEWGAARMARRVRRSKRATCIYCLVLRNVEGEGRGGAGGGA